MKNIPLDFEIDSYGEIKISRNEVQFTNADNIGIQQALKAIMLNYGGSNLDTTKGIDFTTILNSQDEDRLRTEILIALLGVESVTEVKSIIITKENNTFIVNVDIITNKLEQISFIL